MDNTPLHYQTITEIAARVRKGELSFTEYTESCLSRIESLDGKLNAFRLVCQEDAIKHAKAADHALQSGNDLGILQGIPYGAKDLFDSVGLPTTAGAKLLENNIAKKDSSAIARLSQAGMVLAGKTNTVQFAFSGVGINHDHGTPHNPWSRDHLLPGGSSSGTAVAVAAGMVPMALGTDTGGSVRVPASLCGTVGLKTTVGRISRAGVYPLSWTLDSVGMLTRSVEDAALAYKCLQGRDIDDETTWGTADHDVMTDLKNGIQGMKLAFAEAVFMENLHPDVENAVRDCGSVFETLGAKVNTVEFPEARTALQLNPGISIIAAEGYTINKKLLETQFDELDPVVAQRMILGKDVSAGNYLQTCHTARQLRAKAANTLKDVDALLVPATPLPAQPVAEVDTNLENYLERNALYLRNTCIGNVLNMCGVSLPCGFTKDGLPIGLLIYAKPFQEDVALRAGYAFEQATEWHTGYPDLSWLENE
jgi:aspartyl-tRNA(Asn)/glutamyl-tRNA(Gln) amidotransferase subunit A